ncbi:MAG: diguanylate cyclase [Candidatus Eisenbacteria bacterium]
MEHGRPNENDTEASVESEVGPPQNAAGGLSDEMYRTIFELSPEAIVLIDAKGRFVAANGRIFDWLGYSNDELMGKSLLQAPFMPPTSRVVVVKNFVKRMAGLNVPPYELRFVSKSGAVKYGRIHATSIKDENGRAQHDLVMISDVTELKRAEHALEESRVKIEGLHDAARKLEACRTSDDVCRATVDAAKRVLGFQVCVVHMAVGTSLVVRTACSDIPPGVDVADSAPETSSVVRSHRTGKTLVYDSAGGGACADDLELFKSGLCVPVEGAGVFEVLSTEKDAFDEEDVHLLELLLGHTTEAIRSIAMREELEEQVIRDPLTGMYNRRHLANIVGQETERARRYGHRIGLLMIDVDNFKEINDTLGHQTGDLVLRQVARFLRAMVRTVELVIRYGGDEFLVVMPESGTDGDSIISRLERAFGPWSEELDTADIPLRLSMGFDYWEPADRRSIDDVIDSADARMYEDKRRHNSERAGVRTDAGS